MRPGRPNGWTTERARQKKAEELAKLDLFVINYGKPNERCKHCRDTTHCFTASVLREGRLVTACPSCLVKQAPRGLGAIEFSTIQNRGLKQLFRKSLKVVGENGKATD